MKLAKSPPELIATFDAVMPGAPAERRLMFGYPAGFVNGNMFAGLFGDRMHVRLPEHQRNELIKLGGKTFEPMPGRPMREYVEVPPSIVANRAALSRWITDALNYAASLPAKKSSKKAGAKKRS